MGLTDSEMVVRMLAAFVAGLCLGWERETRGRPAGLRTTILTCVAAALAMIVSEKLFVAAAVGTAGGSWRPDPARLGAGILTGIGFLGGGTILRNDNFVRGVTTAATLWFSTVLGLAFGSGELLLGFVGMVVALFTLLLLGILEKRIRSDAYARVILTVGQGALSDEAFSQRLEAAGVTILSVKLAIEVATGERTIDCEIRLTRPERFRLPSRIVKELSTCAGVKRIRWE